METEYPSEPETQLCTKVLLNSNPRLNSENLNGAGEDQIIKMTAMCSIISRSTTPPI